MVVRTLISNSKCIVAVFCGFVHCEPVRALSLFAMTGNGRCDSVPVFDAIPQCFHCELVRLWQSSLRHCVGCRGDAVSCPVMRLDCRVAALLAMTGCGVVGGVGRGLVFGHIPQRCHCEPHRGAVGRVSVFGRIALRCHCEPRRAWQSSRGRYVGCRDDAGVALCDRWIAASG